MKNQKREAMRNFIKHFAEKWLRYLIALILIFIFWLVIIDTLVAVKPEHKLGIFIGAFGISPKLEECIEKPNEIEEIEILDVNINEDYYFVIFSAYASSGDFDFSIINEQQFRESDIQYYLVLDEQKLINYFGEQEYYCVNDQIYGIKIYDGKTQTGILSDAIIYGLEGQTDDYYLFFHKKSTHLGDLNSSADDKAIQTIKNILNKYNIGENSNENK